MSERLTWSVAETAELLGVCQATVRLAIREGRLPAIRFGRRYLILRSAVETLLATAEEVIDTREADLRTLVEWIVANVEPGRMGGHPARGVVLNTMARENVTVGPAWRRDERGIPRISTPEQAEELYGKGSLLAEAVKFKMRKPDDGD